MFVTSPTSIVITDLIKNLFLIKIFSSKFLFGKIMENYSCCLLKLVLQIFNSKFNSSYYNNSGMHNTIAYKTFIFYFYNNG